MTENSQYLEYKRQILLIKVIEVILEQRPVFIEPIYLYCWTNNPMSTPYVYTQLIFRLFVYVSIRLVVSDYQTILH